MDDEVQRARASTHLLQRMSEAGDGKDALSAHARDELGISEISTARPVQAALASAATFSVGAVAPLALVLVSPSNVLIPAVAAGSLLFLSLLGAIGAKAGGAGLLKPTIRVAFWGACAMATLLARLCERPFAKPLGEARVAAYCETVWSLLQALFRASPKWLNRKTFQKVTCLCRRPKTACGEPAGPH